LIGLFLKKDSFNKSKIYESLPGEKTAFIGRVIGELVRDGYLMKGGV